MADETKMAIQIPMSLAGLEELVAKIKSLQEECDRLRDALEGLGYGNVVRNIAKQALAAKETEK